MTFDHNRLALYHSHLQCIKVRNIKKFTHTYGQEMDTFAFHIFVTWHKVYFTYVSANGSHSHVRC